MKLKFILSFFLLIVSVVSVQAVDYYVDNSVGGNGDDDNDGSFSSPFKTLANALDKEDVTVIHLKGSGPYEITPNKTTVDTSAPWNPPFLEREITSDLIIYGDGLTSVTWQPYYWNEVAYPNIWSHALSVFASLSLSNLAFDFDMAKLTNNISFKIFSGNIKIDNCKFGGLGDNKFYFSSNSSGSVFTNCYFQDVNGVDSDMSKLVYGYSPFSVSINPFYLTSAMDKSYHIYEGGGNTSKIIFGNPEPGDNILMTNLNNTPLNRSISGGNYGELLIVGDVDVTGASGAQVDSLDVKTGVSAKIAGVLAVQGTAVLGSASDFTIASGAMVSSASLVIRDDTRLTVDGALNVTGNVHVYDDAFVNTTSNFGNTTTTIDLAFTPEVFRYFTPPFDIIASDLGQVESDEDASGETNSVWLYEYDEAARATGNKGWQFITDPNHELIAGRGYCIWSNAAKISLTGNIAYPNLNGQAICEQIACTNGEKDGIKGFNYLGNTYSLPLKIPTNDKIKAYFYADSESNYACMSGKGGIVAGYDDAYVTSLTIPSYGAFFLQATEAACEGFSVSNLLTNSTVVRIKSENVVQAPQYIRIALRKENSYDDAVVRFEQDADADYDFYDVQKVYPMNATTRSLISTADESSNGDYVIQGLPAIDELGYGEVIELPLHLESASAGVYDVSVSFNNMASGDMNVSLYDKENGSSQALTDESNATVQLPASGKIQGRYSLKVMRSGVVTSLTTAIDKAFRISKTSDHLMVSLNGDDQGIVSLFDISGKLITTSFISTSCQISTKDVVSGVYLVAITTKSGQAYREKVVL